MAERVYPRGNWVRTILLLSPWLLMAVLSLLNIMFAPPYTLMTLALYGLLWLLGSILLGIHFWRRDTRGRKKGCFNLIEAAAIALVVAFLLLTLAGPLLGTAVGIANTGNRCSTESLPSNNIRYICHEASGLTTTLEGPSGLPFVHLVSPGNFENG